MHVGELLNLGEPPDELNALLIVERIKESIAPLFALEGINFEFEEAFFRAGS